MFIFFFVLFTLLVVVVKVYLFVCAATVRRSRHISCPFPLSPPPLSVPRVATRWPSRPPPRRTAASAHPPRCRSVWRCPRSGDARLVARTPSVPPRLLPLAPARGRAASCPDRRPWAASAISSSAGWWCRLSYSGHRRQETGCHGSRYCKRKKNNN